MIVLHSDPAFPFAYNYDWYEKGILDQWGERCSVLDLLFWERGGYFQVVIQLYANNFFTK